MKKLLLSFLSVFILISSVAAQSDHLANIERKPFKYYKHFGAGIGYAYANGVNARQSSSSLCVINFSILNLYVELGFNGAKGKGEHLNFSSSETRQADKTSVLSYAIGWNINLYKDKLILTPKIGSTTESDIYEDPVGWNTYYMADRTSRFLAGIQLQYFFHKNIGMSLGAATTQPINIQILMRF